MNELLLKEYHVIKSKLKGVPKYLPYARNLRAQLAAIKSEIENNKLNFNLN
jgi:hypothetical protein